MKMDSDQVKITIGIQALRKLDSLIPFLETSIDGNKDNISLRFGCDLAIDGNQNLRDLDNNLRFTSFLSFKNDANGEIKWEGSNQMSWTMSYTNFKHIMPSFHQGIKIYVFKSKNQDATTEEIGWTIIDFQNLKDDCSNNPNEWHLSQWLPINGPIHGSEIKLNLNIKPVNEDLNRLGDSRIKQEEELNDNFPVEEDCISLSSSIKGLPIGNGKDVFLLTIKLNEVRNLQNLVRPNHFIDNVHEVWLSYAIFDVMIQTDKFYISNSAFSPVVDMFRLQSSTQELMTYFDNNYKVLEIHICTNGSVLGSVNCDMRLIFDGFDVNKIPKIHGYFSVNNSGKLSNHVHDDEFEKDETAVISLTILLQELPKSQDLAIKSSPKIRQKSVEKNNSDSFSSQTRKTSLETKEQQSHKVKTIEQKEKENDGLPQKRALNESINETEDRPQNETRKRDLKNEAEANKLLANLEKGKREWEEWKHQEEIKWQEQLKEKEILAMRALHEQAMIKEKESADVIETARIEQKKLEARLRKALMDVEDRERRLILEEENRRIEYRSNLSEMQMQQKILKEETKHIVDLEKAKLAAAVNRATLAEKSASIAEKRYQKLEEDFENYRTKTRRTPEAALQQEIMSLKAHLGDSEAKMERERTEKHQILVEKEMLQNKIQSLMRTLNREREKNAARERRERENLRLECMAREQRMIMDGDRNELQRIKDELNNLSQLGNNMRINPLTPFSKRTESTISLKSPYECRTPSQERYRERSHPNSCNK